MSIITMKSEEVRQSWRDSLDRVYAGDNDIIVERYNKPVAAIINYDDYLALLAELEDLRIARRAQAALDEWRRDPSSARPWKDVETELMAEGLLDAGG